uniref:Cation-transporting P-type ATPase C-terminal domain-containing protein n=1 Tax=Globisporangium ultimum (strain ATCC 200006 / CBS 805.95 / DAOM BR144) TaxID=431595 RepID=K3X9U4_GLOUD
MKKDKLMSSPLLLYSYMVAGMVNVCGCFLAYSAVFWCHGISLSDIFLLSDSYWQDDAPDFCVDVFHVWMCKTRRISILRHELFNNIVMTYGSLLSLSIAVILVYVPALQDVTGSASVDYVPWLIALGTGSITWLYREDTKCIVRRDDSDTKGFVAQHLTW